MPEREAGPLPLRAVNAIHAAANEDEVLARLKQAVAALTGAVRVSVREIGDRVPAEVELGGNPAERLAAPLTDSEGRCHGWLHAQVEPPARFTPDDRDMLQALAESGAIALANCRTGSAAEDGPPLDTLNDLAQRLAEVGGWSVDLRTSRAYWTDQKAAIHGLPGGTWLNIDEAIGMFAPECQEVVSKAFAACAGEGLPYDLELQLVTQQGQRRWVRTIGVAERDRNGRIVRVNGAFQDISGLKAAEERYRSTLESLTDALFTLDREWCFTYLNAVAERLLRQGRDQLLGRSLWQLFPETKGSQFEQEYRLAVADGRARQFTAFYPPLNAWFLVSAQPSSEGLAVFFQDVTEQRMATEALRESEARLRFVAKATTDTVWEWNLTEGSLWWGEGGEALFGPYRSDPPPDIDEWSQRIHPADRERVLLSLQDALNTGRQNWAAEYLFRKADGSHIQVADRGFVICDAAGKPVRLVGGMTDITLKRAVEARLSQAQRLEAVGQLTGGVAHDFNNLLTVILGNAEALRDALGQDQRLFRLAEMTCQAAERGSQLTGRLLAVARRQPLQPRPVDLFGLVSGMRDLLQQALGVSIDLALVRAEGSWEALVDAAQLEAALLNLCLNARDAMPEGGQVSIAISNAALAPEEAAAEPDVLPGAYLLLEVSDTGCGMPAEVLAHAFEPFFTTKGMARGSGLGLSTVYGFARQSGGTVRLASQPGKGTTVRLYLPPAEIPAVQDGGENGESPLLCGSEKILLVEDDDLVRDHVALQLARLGYRVAVARNGQEGLDRLREEPDIDLLFTDIMMPGGMDGGQLAAQARLHRPELKVMFTSGFTDASILRDGRLDPDVLLLKKPYRRSELALALRQVLEADRRDGGEDGHGQYIADR